MAAYGGTVLEALADRTRRSIFEMLADGPRSVIDISGDVPISRPAVSQHLKVLKDAGIVSVRAAGTRRIYCRGPAGLRAVREYFDQFWTCRPLGLRRVRQRDRRSRDRMHRREHRRPPQHRCRRATRSRVRRLHRRGSTRGGSASTTSSPASSRRSGIEPRVGGRLWEEAPSTAPCAARDGCTVWDPPGTFGFAWLIPPDWSVPPTRPGKPRDGDVHPQRIRHPRRGGS